MLNFATTRQNLFALQKWLIDFDYACVCLAAAV